MTTTQPAISVSSHSNTPPSANFSTQESKIEYNDANKSRSLKTSSISKNEELNPTKDTSDIELLNLAATKIECAFRKHR